MEHPFDPTIPLPVDLGGERRVYTVTELTRQIRGLLEDHFPFVWVEGEISNFRVPVSGHYYFVLKDENSQIRAVMFRNQQRWLRFQPEDGMRVLCQARVTVYEPRGEYQLLVESMEPRGIGALQLAYEQLKKRLAAEGLFDPEHKKPIPFLPQRLGVVTSATGAAIRDIIRVSRRRFANLEIFLYPVRVQGEGAAREIAAGIDAFNREFPVDVIIVGRGGGSWEDLWAFNEEEVVRAIFRSEIPVISAVGHEIDTTLSDLVADVRAPTPSAAAELVVQHKESLEARLKDLGRRLCQRTWERVTRGRERLDSAVRRLRHPAARLADLRLYLDDRLLRLQAGLPRLLRERRRDLARLQAHLDLLSPIRMVNEARARLDERRRRLLTWVQRGLERRRGKLQEASARLQALSPLAILARGYSITTKAATGEIVRSYSQVAEGEIVRVRLHEGGLACEVKETREESW